MSSMCLSQLTLITKKEKCIGKGVTEGGNHGKTFMPEYLAFWRENLLN